MADSKVDNKDNSVNNSNNNSQTSDKQASDNGDKHKNKQRLGRGLDSLIPTGLSSASSVGVSTGLAVSQSSVNAGLSGIKREGMNPTTAMLSELMPNPFQPRQRFAEDELNSLANSIKKYGILQPIVVQRLQNGLQDLDSLKKLFAADNDSRSINSNIERFYTKDVKYIIIAGERRWRAAGLAKLINVPIIIKNITSETERIELALIENVQREDINPVELAQAYSHLIEKFNYTHDTVGEIVGKTRATVTNSLRLLKLHPDVIEALKSKLISEGHGKALLACQSVEGQLALLKMIIEKGLSVREVEQLAKSLENSDDKKQDKKEKPRPVYISELENELQELLSAKVLISKKGAGGVIKLEYSNDEHLDQIILQLRELHK